MSSTIVPAVHGGNEVIGSSRRELLRSPARFRSRYRDAVTDDESEEPELTEAEQRANLRKVGWIFVVLFLLLGFSTYRLMRYGTAEDMERASRYALDPNNGALAP